MRASVKLRQMLGTGQVVFPIALSASRAAIAPLIWVLLQEGSIYALPLYLLACITDLLDGFLARLFGSARETGLVIDASADFIILAFGLGFYVTIGLVPVWFICIMALSFLQFLVTCGVEVNDKLGKHVGTVLYLILALLVFTPTLFVSNILVLLGTIYIITALFSRSISVIESRHSWRGNN